MTAVFGLDANTLPPPFSAILSLAMIAGVDALGALALRKILPNGNNDAPWLRFQAPVVGAALLAAVTFPLVLTGAFPRALAMGIAVALTALGIGHGMTILWRATVWNRLAQRMRGGNLMTLVLTIFVISYGLLALGPVTEADSLDYHIGVALDLLNTGAFPVRPEWFHSRLAGSGEVLIAIGLSVGAEQFGSLIQLVGVLSVASLFLSMQNRQGSANAWIALCIVSCPVFIAWVASPKPMLLPGAMTTTALMITYFRLRELSAEKTTTDVRNAFLLVCLLTMTAATMKFNFLLSGGVVGGWAMVLLLRSRFRWIGLRVASLMFCLILLPFACWKILHFGGSLFGAFFQALPGGWPGTADFETLLRAYRDTTVIFPVSLLVPSGVGAITTILGAGLLLIVSCLPLLRAPSNREIVILAVIVSVGGMVLGQRNARFFLEPFYWLLIACHLGWGLHPILYGRAIKVLISVQATAVYVMLLVGVVTVLPGALLPQWRENIMHRLANGYTAMKWAGDVLPPDASMISTIRSVALSPRYVIPNDWRAFLTEGDAEEQVYTSLIVEKKPGFVLVLASRGEAAPQFRCTQGAYAGPYSAQVATRNPFNAGAPYDAWLLLTDLSCMTASVP